MDDSNEYEEEDYDDAIDIDENDVFGDDDNDAFIRGHDFSDEDDYSNEVEMSSEGDGESNSDRADEDDYDDIDVSIEGDGESNSERDDEHIEYIRPEINDNEEMSDDDDDNYADDNNDDEIIRNYVAEMYSEGEYEYESDEDILSEVDDESIEEDMMRDRMRWRVQVQANDPGLIKLEIDQADFFFWPNSI